MLKYSLQQGKLNLVEHEIILLRQRVQCVNKLEWPSVRSCATGFPAKVLCWKFGGLRK